LELAIGRVDAEYRNIVGILVGGVQKASRWIQVHPSRPLPACRLPTNNVKFAGFRLDSEHRDTIMTAIGRVEKPPVWVDANFTSLVGAGKIGRQRRDRLLPNECRAYPIIVENGNREGQLGEDVGVLSVGVEGHVPRPGTGRDRRERHRVWDQLAGAGIKVPHIILVSAEVYAEDMIAIEVR